MFNSTELVSVRLLKRFNNIELTLIDDFLLVIYLPVPGFSLVGLKVTHDFNLG